MAGACPSSNRSSRWAPPRAWGRPCGAPATSRTPSGSWRAWACAPSSPTSARRRPQTAPPAEHPAARSAAPAAAAMAGPPPARRAVRLATEVLAAPLRLDEALGARFVVAERGELALEAPCLERHAALAAADHEQLTVLVVAKLAHPVGRVHGRMLALTAAAVHPYRSVNAPRRRRSPPAGTAAHVSEHAGACPGSRPSHRTSRPATSSSTTTTWPGCSSCSRAPASASPRRSPACPARARGVGGGAPGPGPPPPPPPPAPADPAADGRSGGTALPRRLVRGRLDPRA